MASDAQIVANRANSRRSTGPKSADGKATSARNSFRHGFRSLTPILPGDDPAEFRDLLRRLSRHFSPVGLTEERCVREMADADWRLYHVRFYLANLVTDRFADVQQEFPEEGPARLQYLASKTAHVYNAFFAGCYRYESKFERQYQRAYNTLLNGRKKERLKK